MTLRKNHIYYILRKKQRSHHYENITKGVISVLIILGIVKTFQDHDILNEASYYYEQAKSGELVQDISNLDFNNFKI